MLALPITQENEGLLGSLVTQKQLDLGSKRSQRDKRESQYLKTAGNWEGVMRMVWIFRAKRGARAFLRARLRRVDRTMMVKSLCLEKSKARRAGTLPCVYVRARVRTHGCLCVVYLSC